MLVGFFSLGVCWRTPEAISRRISLSLFLKSSWLSRKVEVMETTNFWQILRVDDLRGDVTLKIYFACWIFLAWVWMLTNPWSYFKKNFILLVPQKLVVKPQSRSNGNKNFLTNSTSRWSSGWCNSGILFCLLDCLAWVYADEPLKLFQEEFHCACSSKARGKAVKSS